MSARPHFTRGLVCSVVRSLFRPTDNLGLVLGLVRVSSCFRVRIRVRIRVKVRVSIMVRLSIRTSWVVNFALFRY